jgi:NADH:ubiquinone reductase (H+-translocating)
VSYPLKDLPDALDLRYRVLEQFERASATADPATRTRLLTFAIVGGGPTGVEYAGALSELVRLVLHRDFPELDVRDVGIHLLEGRDRILPPFSPRLGRAAARTLQRKGIVLHLGVLVRGVRDGVLALADGSSLEAATVVWTAGVRGADLSHGLVPPPAGVTRDGRIPVAPTLQLPGHPEVLVAGDLALVPDPRHEGRPYPMLAPVAIQQGRHAGRLIAGLLRGQPSRPFRFVDRGTMATIGRNAAVAEIGPLRFSGRLAWLTWLVVHLALIIGFRNRLVVLLNWAWDYLFFDRPIRIMTATRRGGEERWEQP